MSRFRHRKRQVQNPGARTQPVDIRRTSPDATCQKIREALSAGLDREPVPEETHTIQRHLSVCVPCQDFKVRSAALKRTVSLGPAPAMPDLTDEILSAIGLSLLERPGRWRVDRRHGRRLSRLHVMGWAIPVVALGVLVPTVVVGAVGHLHIAPMNRPGPCLNILMHNMSNHG